MLKIKEICKKYVTGDLVQTALDNVSLNLRDNEFVAILGPSGSGKTTLLNIIGGLDRYDSGDLIINGISTKKYKDKDWDSYRNHSIGFVFQSYNLIPHQSVLANVELALTISGISKAERKKRAKEALEQVGLGDQIHKKPNQMSGGQMQRVAIARALVNDPSILLADEPTGALDSETSVQVMELLKEVAKERLVVMVTHNPELAEQYANRIVRVKDGSIVDDSNPYEMDTELSTEPEHKNMGKSSMSFFTSLSLSFNNLRTKKGRTILTAFAGSIGIIGIALILSLSNGVNTYITDIQRDTMSSYPITIEAQTIDLSSLIETTQDQANEQSDHDKDAVYSDNRALTQASTMTSSLTENNLTAFKKYLDNESSDIHNYTGDNGIVYSYDTKFSVYSYDEDNKLINADGTTFTAGDEHGISGMMSMSTTQNMSMTSMMTGSTDVNHFSEILPSSNGEGIATAVADSYDVVYGAMPSSYNEIAIVLDKNNEISATTLYDLGLLPSSEYVEILKQINNGEEVIIDTKSISYEDICKHDLYLVPECDRYILNENGTYSRLEDSALTDSQLSAGIKLKVTGIIRLNEDTDSALITSSVGYTKALTDYLIKHTDESAIVTAQKDNADINVLTGVKFTADDDAAKIESAKTYLSEMSATDKATFMKNLLSMQAAAQAMGGTTQSTDTSGQMSAIDPSTLNDEQLSAYLDQYLKYADDESMLSVYESYLSTGTYDSNLTTFGVVDENTPSSINIYADSFENKDEITSCIEAYNTTVTNDDDKITYTDYVGMLMSSVTTIINVISYVLIAFVGVSLIVSSIMIGIITYISVLERTKEIGILRAIGASKQNISQVFNAETFIIGLFSGLMGIAITLLMLIPANLIIHAVADTDSVNASLPIGGAIILIVLSVILTLIGGIIPSKKAAKKDPVTALRTE